MMWLLQKYDVCESVCVIPRKAKVGLVRGSWIGSTFAEKDEGR